MRTKPMQRDPILEAVELTKSFVNGQTTLQVLQSISFALDPGSSCAIVGPSGSGKTTLLGLCAGLDLPTSGSIRIAGQSLESLDEDARARLRNGSVGFVFQNFQLIPTLTALENVMVPVELRGGTEARRLGTELLGSVGLGERLSHYPVQLSGGEQQRVALARAFVNRPKLLFADEPTGNLDAETGHHVIEMLFQMKEAFGTTLVLVTHDLELAERAGAVIRLRGGRVVEQNGLARPFPVASVNKTE
jgi:putative ABC transport system ATP-binding protein